VFSVLQKFNVQFHHTNNERMSGNDKVLQIREDSARGVFVDYCE
jgi:hypothetical protein